MIIHQYAENVNQLYKYCLNQLKTKIPEGFEHVIHEKCPFPELYSIPDPRLRSDAIRVRWLMGEGEVGYIDADTFCTEFPNISSWKKDKPWVSIGGNGLLAGGIILSFGCNKFWKEVWKRYDSLQNKRCGWLQKLLQEDFKNDVYKIPNGYFLDANLNSVKNINFLETSNTYCTIKNDNGNLYFSRIAGGILNSERFT